MAKAFLGHLATSTHLQKSITNILELEHNRFHSSSVSTEKSCLLNKQWTTWDQVSYILPWWLLCWQGGRGAWLDIAAWWCPDRGGVPSSSGPWSAGRKPVASSLRTWGCRCAAEAGRGGSGGTNRLTTVRWHICTAMCVCGLSAFQKKKQKSEIHNINIKRWHTDLTSITSRVTNCDNNKACSALFSVFWKHFWGRFVYLQHISCIWSCCVTHVISNWWKWWRCSLNLLVFGLFAWVFFKLQCVEISWPLDKCEVLTFFFVTYYSNLNIFGF